MNTKKKTPKFLHIILISFFLGIFGIDRLLLGYKNWWIKGITLGGLFIWAFKDLFDIMTLKLKMVNGDSLS